MPTSLLATSSRHLGSFVAPGSVPRETHGAEYGHADVLAAPHLLLLANHPHILEVGEAYLGAIPVIAALRTWWTVPTPGAQPEATELFHRDVDDYRFLKLFVYLTDVDERSGPHVFARGSHTQPALCEIRRYRDDEVARVIEQDDLIRFTGCAGTAFLEVTYGLHRAKPPVARPRLAFSALYTMRPTIYGPARPLRAPSAEEQDLSSYVNQVYLRA